MLVGAVGIENNNIGMLDSLHFRLTSLMDGDDGGRLAESARNCRAPNSRATAVTKIGAPPSELPKIGAIGKRRLPDASLLVSIKRISESHQILRVNANSAPTGAVNVSYCVESDTQNKWKN